MTPGPRIPKNPGKPAVKIPMGQRKSGLAAPADKLDICKHLEIVGRIAPRFDRYVCGDCKEKVVLVPLAGKLMTEPEFDQFQMEQVLAQRAAQRKQKTGLVTLDEVRREQQAKEGRK